MRRRGSKSKCFPSCRRTTRTFRKRSRAAALPGFWKAMEAAQGEDALAVYQGALIACAVRERGIEHLHAHFATAATSAARLASHFAKVPYTFTAHAKDVFHDTVRPDDLRRKLRDAGATITVSDFNRDYLQRTYGDAAVFAAPCVVGADGDRDGLPTVLVEAMALGTPCVSTDVTGIPELLADDCGIVVPQHDPTNLAAALERLLT